MSDDGWDEGVDIPNCECLRETNKAVLVTRGGGELWIPKSVLHDDSEVYEGGDRGKLVVQTWWAEQNGVS